MSDIKRGLVIGLITGLIFGAIFGLSAAPKGADVSKYERQINRLKEQVISLQHNLESKNKLISDLQAQISDLRVTLKRKDEQISALRSQISNLKLQIERLKHEEIGGNVSAFFNFTEQRFPANISYRRARLGNLEILYTSPIIVKNPFIVEHGVDVIVRIRNVGDKKEVVEFSS